MEGILTTAQEKAIARSADHENLVGELVRVLKDLHCLVWSECPSLLNEDSGGNSALDLQIKSLIAKGEAQQ